MLIIFLKSHLGADVCSKIAFLMRTCEFYKIAFFGAAKCSKTAI